MNYIEIKSIYGVTFIKAKEKGGEKLMYWLTGLAGAILMAVPFILGFGSVASATWTTLIIGAVIAVLAGSKLWSGGAS